MCACSFYLGEKRKRDVVDKGGGEEKQRNTLS